MLSKISILLATILFVPHANAAWNFRPQVGVGASSNVYFVAENPTSDFYAWTRVSGSNVDESNAYSFSLTYRGYAKTPGNNIFNYRALAILPLTVFNQPSWEIEFSAGGQDYLQGSPGTTEQSFDYFYGRIGLIKTIRTSSDKEIILQPSYEARSYPGLSGRFDQDFSARAILNWALSPSQELEPYFGFGLLYSNQEVYTRRYIDLGIGWAYRFASDLKLSCDLSITASSYPHRTITTSTVVTNRRGRVFASSQAETEAQTLTQTSASLVKILKGGELKGTIGVLSNASRSGAVDYSELNISGSYTHYF